MGTGTLATIIGGVGAVLLLVGLVGGGFQFSGSVMPRVGSISRVLCFAIGGALVVASFGLVVGAPAGQAKADVHPTTLPSPFPQPGPPAPAPAPPAAGYVMVGTGYTAYVFELPSSSSLTVADVDDGAEVHIVCTVQGEAVTSPVTGVSSSLWNMTTDGGFIPDVMVNTGTDQPTMPNCLS